MSDLSHLLFAIRAVAAKTPALSVPLLAIADLTERRAAAESRNIQAANKTFSNPKLKPTPEPLPNA